MIARISQRFEAIPGFIPTVILNDNKRAIDLSNNSGYRPRTKHIDTHHFIKEKVDSSEIKIEYVPTEMTEDVLTKGLFAPKFKDY